MRLRLRDVLLRSPRWSRPPGPGARSGGLRDALPRWAISSAAWVARSTSACKPRAPPARLPLALDRRSGSRLAPLLALARCLRTLITALAARPPAV